MNSHRTPAKVLALTLSLCLPSSTFAQWRSASGPAAAGHGAAVAAPALSAPQLEAAVPAGFGGGLVGPAGLPSPVAGASAAAEQSASAAAAAVAAASARFEQPGSAPAAWRATAKASLAVPALLRRAENPFQGSGPAAIEAAAGPWGSAAPAPQAELSLPTAKLVAQLRELAKHDPKAALESVDRLLASDPRIEVRLAAIRVAGAIPGEGASLLLAANLAKETGWYARRESAKQLGLRASEAASYNKEDRAAVVGALRRALEETAAPQEVGARDSVFLMAAWAFERLGEDVSPFAEKRAAAAAAQTPPAKAEPAAQPGQAELTPREHRFHKVMKWLALGSLLAMLALPLWAPSPQPHAPAPAAIEQTMEKPSPKPLNPELKAEAPKKAPDAAESLDAIAKQLKAQNERAERLEQQRQQSSGGGFFSGIGGMIMSALIFIGIFQLIQRLQGIKGGAPKMGQFKLESTRPTTRFHEVAGADDARKEVEEIVDFLKNPAKYKKLGAKLPKGALLVGPPGTGKTLMARAVAGETGANFYTVSGSDFVEMFVGVGASRVREMFEKAKQNAPAIIFIDEIDAVGKKRGQGMQSNDEREGTLNAMLVEMDGFDNSSGVVVLAATNREDVLDPALLRPGRFDRKVHVGLPDVLGREAILQIHASKTPLAPDADLELVAKRTAGLSGAFLSGVVNEGALEGSRRSASAVGPGDLDKGIAKNTIGAERPNMFVPLATKKRIADHEIGHVLVGWHTTGNVPYKVTAIPHGPGALGYAESASEDEFLHSEPHLKNRLAVLMGGRAAEKLLYGNFSSGADNDLEVATRIARAMVQRWGMGRDTGFAQTTPDPNSFAGSQISQATARKIDREVERLLQEAQATAVRILTEHAAAAKELSKRLVENETMFGEEIQRVAAGSR